MGSRTFLLAPARVSHVDASPLATVLAVSHPWDLTDDEFAAIRALQRGEAAPPIGDPVWRGLLEMWMVWIDKSGDPHVVRLTPIGRNYDAS
ncbi:MAG: hypothetical protein QOI71_1631 [Gaiellales bacterium]|nr:hypothetical protein [Gaiellales bacterium]